MIADAFVSLFVENLAELTKEEVAVLLGVQKDLKTLEKKLRKMNTVVEEAERRSLEEDPIINNWLKDLKEVMYDADDIIDECRIEGEMRRSSSTQRQQSTTTSRSVIRSTTSSLFRCFGKVVSRHDIGRRIMEINTKLEEIYKESSGFRLPDVDGRGRNTWRENKMILKTSPVVVDSDIVGLKKDVDELVVKLTEGNKQRIGVFTIWGMGGIGKTTLAQKIYNNGSISGHFDIKMWVCVSQKFEEIDLLKEIIRQGKGSYGESQTRAELDPILKELVGGKKLFLVLDDVWHEKVWENLLRKVLQTAHANSRVLTTSRKKEVGLAMGAVHFHEVELPSVQAGWLILQNKVLQDSPIEEIEELRCIGVEIVKKCNRLPLAIQTIGGVLIKKERNKEAWERVLASPAWSFTSLPEEILPALYYSYEDLHSHLKQCFLYCSLFPEDYRFYQTYLVHTWVAEGFVNAQEGLEVEDVAREYYNDLISRSLLQVASFSNNASCKMHDLLRLLALFVAKRDNHSENLQGLSITFATARRLSIINEGISEISDEIKKQKCLRTMILEKNRMIVNIPEDLFVKLRRLRILNLGGTQIEKLPESVKNLLHLRYLDLSYTRLRELPESVKCLRNLLTLDISECKNLQKHPSAIVHMCNLRHLVMHGIRVDYLPIGIGNLEHLQELTGFVLKGERGNEGQLGATIKELKSLSSLRYLSIYKLERVANKAEAQEASLLKKSKLESLQLSCTSGLHFEEGEINTIKEVFEELTPPPCLEGLSIESFFGREFPSWISGSSLPNLTELWLTGCMLCIDLPPLGQQRKLRYLHIWGASSVKSIGAEFLGGARAFPLLEELDIKNMSNWEEWVELEDGDLPRMEMLTLVDCPKLKSLPDGLHHATSLRELVLDRVVSLKSIKNLPSITKLWIRNTPMLECVSNLPALEIIDIRDCPALKEMKNLDALRQLWLNDGNMVVLPEWLRSMTTLQRLDIVGNSNLLKRCDENGEDWHKIQHISQVYLNLKAI